MKEEIHILHIAASISTNSAAGRLCLALRSIGCRITTLAAFPPPLEDGLFFSKKIWQSTLRSRLGKVPLYLYPRRKKDMPWSTPFWGNDLEKWVKIVQPDLIHLHWTAASTINVRNLYKLQIPIVWTFHDVWPITAGCHCNEECTQWRTGCAACPQLGNSILGFNISKLIWDYKRRSFNKAKIDVICPSKWIAKMASESPLWINKDIHILGNALDTNTFSPANKIEMRYLWGLPIDTPIILFGATMTSLPYKGFDLLLQALNHLKYQNIKAHIVIFGENTEKKDLPFPATYVGYIHDSSKLSSLYSSADVLVVPSRQDNLPTTIIEGCSCGLPCVAFSVGGIPEIIIHNTSGYIAQKFDTNDLAYGISYIIKNKEIASKWGENARNHILNNYDSKIIAHRHLNLYINIINNKTKI